MAAAGRRSRRTARPPCVLSSSATHSERRAPNTRRSPSRRTSRNGGRARSRSPGTSKSRSASRTASDGRAMRALLGRAATTKSSTTTGWYVQQLHVRAIGPSRRAGARSRDQEPLGAEPAELIDSRHRGRGDPPARSPVSPRRRHATGRARRRSARTSRERTKTGFPLPPRFVPAPIHTAAPCRRPSVRVTVEPEGSPMSVDRTGVDERAMGALIEESQRSAPRRDAPSRASLEELVEVGREATIGRDENTPRASERDRCSRAASVGAGPRGRGARRRVARAHGAARVRRPDRRRPDAANRDVDRDRRDRDVRRRA